MTEMDWAFRSAAGMAAALRARKISAVELLDLHFSRIDRFDPSLNAIVVQDREGARRSAVAADEALARGEIRGPLHGVPITEVVPEFWTGG